MKGLRYPIWITTVVLVIYNALPFFDVLFVYIFLTLLILTGLTVWMVLIILKKGTPPKTTFDVQWYEGKNN